MQLDSELAKKMLSCIIQSSLEKIHVYLCIKGVT